LGAGNRPFNAHCSAGTTLAYIEKSQFRKLLKDHQYRLYMVEVDRFMQIGCLKALSFDMMK
jgi:hypothetical protein